MRWCVVVALSLSLASALPHRQAWRVRRSSNATSSSEEVDDGIDWQCGSDDLTKYFAEMQVDHDCPTYKAPINNCCLAHDQCYDDQLGRKHCDDVFCECLQKSTVGSPCHDDLGPFFCTAVREFGESAYAASGNGTVTAEVTAATTLAPRNATTDAGSDSEYYDDLAHAADKLDKIVAEATKTTKAH